MSEDPCLVHLPEGEVIGLSFTAFAGFLSAFAVIFVLILVARNYMRNVRNPPPGGEWKLIRTHVDAYLLSFLGSDLMQSLGAILDIKWAAERQVYCSPTCTAQGVIQVIGETGVAMATFAIALHTFLVIFFRWSPSPRHAWIWKVVIAFIWLYVSIYAIAGYAAHHGDANNLTDLDAFYTPTPYWCWISGEFDAERITAEYLWLWIAAFASIILYTFLFFRVRGNITVDPQNWRRIRFKLHRWTASDGTDTAGVGNAYFDGAGRGARGGEAGKTAAREAMSMVWYPVTYTILVLPLSIVRWSTFRAKGQTEPAVPFALTSVVVTVFGLSGITNVVLILLTRKNLLLFGQRGVVNPAKIGLAATGRLPRQNGDAAGGGGPGAAGAGRLNAGQAEKRRFHFHNIGHHKQAAAGKHAGGAGGPAGDVSTDDTTSGERRSPLSPGNTSFAAGRFTTQAYETERSFDVGSGPMPFSPNTAGTDTRDTMMSIKGPRYYQPGELGVDSGIPEGMSYDLGSRGEYDVERDAAAHLSVPVMGTIPIGMLGPDGALHGVSSGQSTQADVSNPSNFLEMKDSRSNPGPQEPLHDIPLYPPPQPRIQPPSHQQPTYTEARRPSATYSEGRRPSATSYPEGRRPSAGTIRTAEGSRPDSAKSKAGSSIHGRKSGDVSDYSVPMKQFSMT
ncbi:hypothetical protein M408DRAFT_242992 [Serendipita vermifera MAFF 305830]|uniref:Uncharacterized protein n=1 Tax=Serendipita vermifera MAFF 305830 TaxID=933852 RepID=A0A0C3AHV7_SERVB|nr:hypothetical protein M408DRAFT_242992 [Serendipita vermifera MAFF 305830]